MNGNRVLEIPCLGKPFQLGMLYDCRNDRLVSNITLWDAENLNKALVSRPLAESQYEVLTNGSLDANMEMVGADANFKLSLLSGLADVPRYDNFLKSNVSSKQQARVTLKYESKVKCEELDINLLESLGTPGKDVDTTNVTHFVAEVLYGFNTFFVFDREVGCDESLQLVRSDMKILVSSLPNISLDATGLAKILEMDREEVSKLICSVYGDDIQQSPPRTSIGFGEAAKFFQELKNNGENVVASVPLKVFLRPLNLLNIPTARFLYEISSDSIAQVQRLMDSVQDVYIRINDLAKTEVYANFITIQKKLSKFKEMTSIFKSNVERNLSDVVFQIRSGTVLEEELAAMLEAIAATPFHQSYLSPWLDGTEKEVKLLSRFLDNFKGIQVSFSAKERQSVVNSFEYDTVVCFSFIVDSYDNQLQEMSSFLHTGAWNEDHLEQRHWYNDQDLVKHMKTLAKSFKSFASAHTDDKNIKFLVTNTLNNNEEGNQAAVIQIFQDGQLTDSQLDEIFSKSPSSNQLLGSSKPESLFSANTIRGNSTLITAAAKPDNRSGRQKQTLMVWVARGGTLTEPKRNTKTEHEQRESQAETVATIWSKPLFTDGHWQHRETHSSEEARDTSGTEALSSTSHPFQRKAMALPCLCRSQVDVVEAPHLHASQMLLAESPTFRSKQNKSGKSSNYRSSQKDIVESHNLHPSQITLGDYPSFHPNQDEVEKSPDFHSSLNEIVETPNLRPSQITLEEFPSIRLNQNKKERSPDSRSSLNDIVGSPNLRPSQITSGEFPSFHPNQNKTETSPDSHPSLNEIVETPNLRPSQITLEEFPSFLSNQNKSERSPDSRSSQNDIMESSNLPPSQSGLVECRPFGQSQNKVAASPNPSPSENNVEASPDVRPKNKAETPTFRPCPSKTSVDKARCSTQRLAEKMKRDKLKIKDNKDGTPAVYRLPMVDDVTLTDKMISKQHIGEPGSHRGVNEKVLMVMGATGAGKSTRINGMANYIMGVKWDDDFRFKLVIDDPNVSQDKSQTKFITAYTFYPMAGSAVPYTFTVIDTPGFGDTDGLQRDREITKQIKEFFSIRPPNGIVHLDGIGFVTQASLARLTPTQEYIYNSVLSIFGKDVAQNIFMLVTFADGQRPPVLQAITKAKIILGDKHFKFNNSALFADNKETEESFDAMFWKMGFRSFETFFAEFKTRESVSLQLTQEVLNEREQLQTLIEGLNPQITIGLNKIEEMRQEELVLQTRVMEIETNKEFTYEVEISKPRQVDISGKGVYTTTCLTCNFTCHPNCAFPNDEDKYKCSAMDKSSYQCTVCPGHCSWDKHKNLPYLIEFDTIIETRTSEDLKKKYESAKMGKSKVEGMIQKLDGFLQDVHSKVLTMISKAQRCLRRLDEIALKPNPLTQVEYLELLIESEKQEAKSGWKQRVQYYEEAKRHAEMLAKVKDVKAAEKKNKRNCKKWR